MIFPRASVLLVAGLLAIPGSLGAASKRAQPTRPAAVDNHTAFKGAIVMDASTGNVLFEDRADTISPPASMTKLMTFAVLNDMIQSGHLTLQTTVTVTAPDSKIGGTQVWLKEKEVFPVEELLYAMMIQSANDAAYALARTSAGSIDAFVEKMNAKARELGMQHTTFRSPHGLPPSTRRFEDSDLTTPRDFAILSRYLVSKTDVLKYTSVKSRPFGAGVRTQPVVMNNHDHLIGHVAGVDGLKTGFTNGAGFCLSATAQRNGQRVIVVVMGSPDSKTRDLKVTELLERGFAALPAAPPPRVASATPAPPAAPGAAADSPVIPVTTPAPKPANSAAAAAPAGAGDSAPMIKFTPPKTRGGQ